MTPLGEALELTKPAARPGAPGKLWGAIALGRCGGLGKSGYFATPAALRSRVGIQ